MALKRQRAPGRLHNLGFHVGGGVRHGQQPRQQTIPQHLRRIVIDL